MKIGDVLNCSEEKSYNYYNYLGQFISSVSGTSISNRKIEEIKGDFFRLKGDTTIFFKISDFEEFVLPKKWCIKRNKENHTIINKYANNFGKNYFKNYDYVNSSLICSTSTIPEGYTEITFEQFCKYVLKQEDIKKEIIGYKFKPGFEKYENAVKNLITDKSWWDLYACKNLRENGWLFAHNNGGIEGELKKAGVLELWFEPVYKEKYEPKTGDIVTVVSINNDNIHWINETSQRTFKILDNNNFIPCDYKGNSDIQRYGLSGLKLRLATKEEFENWKEIETIVIKGYKCEIKNNKIAFGCKTFAKEQLLFLKQLVSDPEIKAELKIDGKLITEEIMSKLINKLN